ncbi:uncharacterized protein TrAtP1_008167 [Trichoderma atroviride]|uniref:H-type lectin domain-containing protein n=1 Tax=Hypocrea atroviridis (strain ATCC 20476 / IMI 206040) TaxID=452589 RepID=G9NZ44_HYPAI|nr:uncharacterized protein TRIATDRAFT_309153 [Trichoderma atroviride IMI 206040]EHK43759.1 hypothetical protein TRIATDRAFT_309153 [Trichoderma atroviride IMI 206040]UKZ67003.1 hypothetical protein TrAtP1_008167 [Trichoderma atroviride]
MEWRSACRVQWEASNVTERQLELTRTGFNGSSSNSSKDSKGSNLTVKSSSVVWIEFDSHEDDFQVNIYNCSKPGVDEIRFEEPYDRCPKIIVWFTALDFLGNESCSFYARAENIGQDGFKLQHSEQKASVAWLAFSNRSKRIKSGHDTCTKEPHASKRRFFSYQLSSDEECLDVNDERAIIFERLFKRTPRTFVAINGIRMEPGKKMNVQVRISKQSAQGFSWTCEAPPGARIDVDWIAFG